MTNDLPDRPGSLSLLADELRAVRELLDTILDVKEHRMAATLVLASEARSKLRAILGEPDGPA